MWHHLWNNFNLLLNFCKIAPLITLPVGVSVSNCPYWFKVLRKNRICTPRPRGWLTGVNSLPIREDEPHAPPRKEACSPSHPSDTYLTQSLASSSCTERWGRASSWWAQTRRISFSTKSLIDPEGDPVISAGLFKAAFSAPFHSHNTRQHLSLPWIDKKKRRYILLFNEKIVSVKLCVSIILPKYCAL